MQATGEIAPAYRSSSGLTGAPNEAALLGDAATIVAAEASPLLVINKSNDDMVTIKMGREIFSAAGSRDRDFLEVIDTGHNGLWTTGAKDALFAFLNRT